MPPKSIKQTHFRLPPKSILQTNLTTPQKSVEHTSLNIPPKKITTSTQLNVKKATVDENDRVKIKETFSNHCTCGVNTSVNFAASLGLLILAAVSYCIAMATKNWSASGHQMKMGLWDFCISSKQNITWSCYPVNTDFSVATQSFSILATMGYACGFVLYILYILFKILHRSRPLTIGMCFIAFSIVSLQIMTLIVYAAKNREMYLKVEVDYFTEKLDSLYLSWSYYFAGVSSIMATVTGVLLFLEFKNLAYDTIYSEPVEQNG